MYIKELSAQTGLPTDTLRYYRKEGLLPPERDGNDYRIYGARDVEWAGFILCLKEMDVSLARIKEYVRLRCLGGSIVPERLTILQAHKETLVAQQWQLAEHQELLECKLDVYQKTMAEHGRREDSKRGYRFVSRRFKILADKPLRSHITRFPPLKSPLKFYTVVSTAEWVECMVRAGADAVQLRYKALRGNELKREIRRCVAARRGSRSQLFVNNHWCKAAAAGAYGVHLGQRDMNTTDFAAIITAGSRLGLSTHSLEEMDRALALHPSYVVGGAVFPTAVKNMLTAPRGLEQLRRQIVWAGGTPVVVIGGITLDNAADVLITGITSLVVVSAAIEAEDPKAAVKSFQALWK